MVIRGERMDKLTALKIIEWVETNKPNIQQYSQSFHHSKIIEAYETLNLKPPCWVKMLDEAIKESKIDNSLAKKWAKLLQKRLTKLFPNV